MAMLVVLANSNSSDGLILHPWISRHKWDPAVLPKQTGHQMKSRVTTPVFQQQHGYVHPKMAKINRKKLVQSLLNWYFYLSLINLEGLIKELGQGPDKKPWEVKMPFSVRVSVVNDEFE